MLVSATELIYRYVLMYTAKAVPSWQIRPNRSGKLLVPGLEKRKLDETWHLNTADMLRIICHYTGQAEEVGGFTCKEIQI